MTFKVLSNAGEDAIKQKQNQREEKRKKKKKKASQQKSEKSPLFSGFIFPGIEIPQSNNPSAPRRS